MDLSAQRLSHFMAFGRLLRASLNQAPPPLIKVKTVRFIGFAFAFLAPAYAFRFLPPSLQKYLEHPPL